MKNDFEEMCKKLRDRKGKCKNCVCSNEYICAYETVKSYVNMDRLRLLKLKADMQRCDFRSLVPTYISVTTLVVSMFTLMATIGLQLGIVYAIIAFAGAMIYWGYIIQRMGKKQYLSDWGEYICIALEEVDKEIQKKEKSEK